MSDETKDDADPGADSGRRWDDEMKALAAIIRALNDLEESARPRILAYLCSRYTEKK